MSCSRYQFELSQCLDGRLPSARRTEVLEHVEACSACAKVWAEMQAAQSLVFGLDEPSVAPSFRDAVWDRIQAGEGAPVPFTEPVSAMQKVRYGVVGAAAAAILLFSVNLFFGEQSNPDTSTRTVDSSTRENPTLTNDGSAIGGSIRRDGTTATDTTPSQDDRIGLTTGPLTPARLASHTVLEVKDAARRLKRSRHAVLVNPQETPRPVWTQIRNDVETLGDGLNLLVTLERENLVFITGRSRSCMEMARGALEGPSATELPETKIQSLVHSLAGCSLDTLDRGLSFPLHAAEFTNRFVSVVKREPRIQRMLMRLEVRVVPSEIDMIWRPMPRRQEFHLYFTQPNGGGPRVRIGAGTFFEPEVDPKDRNSTTPKGRLEYRSRNNR